MLVYDYYEGNLPADLMTLFQPTIFQKNSETVPPLPQFKVVECYSFKKTVIVPK